ncbi:hypothetical protein HDU87_006388 [Geranomyces variabilis]|uniref:Thioesterase domain-containing protein n=1 Tax=Geranomyces variabilis TaxID=109894 RepID=A0AAD5THR3_9FUNG|nr:hypothetical protein HDU87_006388 [Geranomyces variabilis]
MPESVKGESSSGEHKELVRVHSIPGAPVDRKSDWTEDVDADDMDGSAITPLVLGKAAPGRAFFVHDVTGHCGSLAHLSQHFQHNSFVINDPRLDKPTGFSSLKNMAACYSKMIEDFERSSPSAFIVLCGYSIGGMIALEVARCLKGKGFRVKHVVLMDSLAGQVI